MEGFPAPTGHGTAATLPCDRFAAGFASHRPRRQQKRKRSAGGAQMTIITVAGLPGNDDGASSAARRAQALRTAYSSRTAMRSAVATASELPHTRLRPRAQVRAQARAPAPRAAGHALGGSAAIRAPGRRAAAGAHDDGHHRFFAERGGCGQRGGPRGCHRAPGSSEWAGAGMERGWIEHLFIPRDAGPVIAPVRRGVRVTIERPSRD